MFGTDRSTNVYLTQSSIVLDRTLPGDCVTVRTRQEMDRSMGLSSATLTRQARLASRSEQILSAQVQLLYANTNLAVSVTVLAATILSYLEWGFIRKEVIVSWWVYMILVSVLRGGLAYRYKHAPGEHRDRGYWRFAFAAGAALAGAGWGAAGILLYPESYLRNQVFLVFVLGGMMLGAASLLAPRPEAFLAFLIPTGLAPAVRLVFGGDETHVAMGLLAAVFTGATVVTTCRIYRTIDVSLRLRFENRDLVKDLEGAKNHAEALNQALERRVAERTAELSKTTQQLRAEIAQRERMEEELLRARKLESLGVLAGGIAHDFNNFLTVIQGNLEVAKSLLDDRRTAQRVLDQAASTCQRAAFLSSQLLTFAKGGAPVRRVVSAQKLVMDAVHLVKAGASVSIAVEIAEDIGNVEADPGQIGQVLHNILLNARQAMPEGGMIEVRAERVANTDTETDSRVRISIRDYGPGIPSNVLPRIFDPYFSTKPGGSGLGLATAYSIVARHGGHISVESQPGEGATFTIDLPASQEDPTPEEPVVTDPQIGTERILVMDDDQPLRDLLKTVLGRLGYQVATARDGAEAIALFEAAKIAGRPFDAVLLDLTVSGGMGGVEAAAKLKELDPSAKLIVSSGYSEDPAMSEFEKYGFEAVIPKPWKATDVSEVLRRVLVADPRTKDAG
jgi:signal transduction histidine kinase/ActR/RegA family two-component response regulator